MSILERVRRGADRRADRGRRPDRPAVGRNAGHPAAAAVRPDGDLRAGGDQPLRRARARPGTGTTSAPASTPAPTSTRPTTGSPARTARTSPRCRRAGWSGRPSSLDFSEQVAADPDFLLEVDHVREWEAGARPAARTAAGCSTAPAGTPGRHRRRTSSTPTTTGPHTPGHLAGLRALAGRGGAGDRARRGDGRHRRRRGALASTRRSRATRALLGSGKYGLTQLQNLAAAAAHRRAAGRRRRCRSSAAPAPRRGCWRSSSGEHGGATVAAAVGAALVRAGVDQVFGVVGSGNFARHQRDGRRGRPVRGRPAREAARRRWPTPTPG